MTNSLSPTPEAERLRRWRMILGGDTADGTGCALQGIDVNIDKTLEALYDSERKGRGGLGLPIDL